MKFRIVFFLSVCSCLSVMAQEQRLTLAQIIDSATQKHPAFRAAQLKIDAETSQKNAWLNIPQTEFSFTQGKIFNNTTDSRFEIKQPIGSPFSMAAEKKANYQQNKQCNR